MQVEGVHRPARAEISASAIAHNVRAIKSVIGESLFCAVVKANGYGHGSELAAKAALVGGADEFHISLTHTAMTAAAFVVASSKEPRAS